jgi:hypothetical protein
MWVDAGVNDPQAGRLQLHLLEGIDEVGLVEVLSCRRELLLGPLLGLGHL